MRCTPRLRHRRPNRILARTLALAGTSLLAAGLLAWTPSQTTAWNQSSAEGTLWQLLNGARVNNGRNPLKQSGTMVSLARWRSKDQVQRNYFDHTVLGTGYQVYHWYDLNGVSYKWGGENIGWNSGYADADSPVAIHQGFMSSPGHRANILEPAYTHGGVGAYAADNVNFLGKLRSPRFYTELFYVAAGSSTGTTTTRQTTAPPPPPPSRPSQPRVSRPASTPASHPTSAPQPQAATVSAPIRPTASAALDGAQLLLAHRIVTWSPQFLRSLRADDGWATPPVELASAHGRVVAGAFGAEVADAASKSLIESILGSLLGFFLR
jgi:uncharacterized protein YkwD